MTISTTEAADLKDHAARLLGRIAGRASDGRMRPREVALTLGEVVHLLGRVIAALDSDGEPAPPKRRGKREAETPGE